MINKGFTRINFERQNLRGFTLIELLVAMAILAIISTVGLTYYNNAQVLVRDAKRQQDLKSLAKALEVYRNNQGSYVTGSETGDCIPANANSFYDKIAPFMANQIVPKDPRADEQYCYIPSDNARSFRLFAKLEDCSKSNVVGLTNCQGGISWSYTEASVDLALLPPGGTTSSPAPTVSPPAVSPSPAGGGGGSPPPPSTSPSPSPSPSPRVSPAFKSIASVDNSTQSTKTITISKPSQVQQNDLMLAHLDILYSDPFENNPFSPIITPPSNWTLLHIVSKGLDASYIYWKIAGSSEPLEYSWSTNTFDVYSIGVIVAYSGVNVASPIDVSDGQTTFNTTSHSTPSVVTTINNTIIVTFFGIERATSSGEITLASPTGMNERLNNVGSFNFKSSVADVAQPTVGATGAKTATSSLAGTGTAQIVVIK